MSGIPWSVEDIPDLSGRRALVTGVTSGIGQEVARQLAAHGARVVLAARSESKLRATHEDIRDGVPGAALEEVLVDLADLDSVRRAAGRVAEGGPLHLLVNNAGVMATPFQRTVDGFEVQQATNHLGPFALTGRLLPQLVESGDGRVVSTASQMHRLARRAPLGDPRVHEGRYSRWGAYVDSKLSALLFTFELDRRLREAGLPVKALAAHPGLSATSLMGTGHDHGRDEASSTGQILQAVFQLVGQPSELGALPTLMAATADLPGSTYVGPSGLFQARGLPTVVGSTRVARSRSAQAELWRLSELATGVHYP